MPKIRARPMTLGLMTLRLMILWAVFALIGGATASAASGLHLTLPGSAPDCGGDTENCLGRNIWLTELAGPSAASATKPKRRADGDDRCGDATAVPRPAARPPNAFVPGGRYNWSNSYLMQSMLYHFEASGDKSWADQLIDWGYSLLDQRDARNSPDDKPFAWTDHSSGLSEPYVWAGFTGHAFEPLLEFAHFVAEHGSAQKKIHAGKTYREHALYFMNEFHRALALHLSELDDDGRHATFRFIRHVPVASRTINGSPLPVNMNAALFTAMLHLAAADKILGDGSQSVMLSDHVAHFVNYLNDGVLKRVQAGERPYITWQYASYINRADDLGHANTVAKFLYDAYANHYAVGRDDLVALGNSVERLIADDGTIRGNLLDGSTIPGSRSSIYYLILMARFSPTFRAKVAPLVLRSNNFINCGSWLETSQPGRGPGATDP